MFLKYPRTPHLYGSRLQQGDSGHDQVRIEDIRGGELVWEEKLDGANSAISFTANGMQLQSRGHVLTGGAREAQFNLFKKWATAVSDDLYCILGDRYIMYGEWCFAKHTVFYDNLEHYFYEFDIYDKQENVWLDTETRHAMLADCPVVSVPVIHRGHLQNVKDVRNLIKNSAYKTSNWKDSLIKQAISHGIDPEQVVKETEKSDLAEGLYLKHEQDGVVIARYKFVRPDFHQTILDSGSHWSTRKILPNMLKSGIDIFVNI